MRFPEGFVHIPQRLAGNTQSGHKVVFGVMNGQEVAVKPFTGGKGRREHGMKARHEEGMYRKIGDLGYLTLVPTGVIETDEAAFLITRYEPNIMPVSALPLGEAGMDHNIQGLGPTEAVRGVAHVLGRMHNDRVTHGDAKPRNFSFHRISGSGPIVIDMEKSQDHMDGHKANEFFAGAIKNDAWHLAFSLGFQGFGGQKMKQAHQLFDELVLDVYHDVAETPLPARTITHARNGLVAGRGKYFST